MRKLRFILAALGVAMATLGAGAADYTSFLAQDRGFTKVTTFNDIVADANYYYILASAENTGLIVGVGAYEGKPDWASTESKALRYKSADTDPVLDLSNFFTIEKNGQYIGLRNAVYSADLFQTHDNAGYMYVNTYTDKSLDEWSYLTPTYQDGYWFFESGKYPMSSGNWACGYLGPWNKSVAAGEPIALNRRNTAGDEAGHYCLFRIAKADYEVLYKDLNYIQLLSATTTNPVDATWLITNPSFETGDETGWTLQYKDANNNEFKTREYGMTYKEGGYLMNVYQLWNDHSVSQVVNDVPSGEYELSAVLCSWADRTATLTGQASLASATATAQGIDDQTGIPVSVNVKVGNDQQLTIIANSTTDWWSDGHTDDYYKQLFYKVDNVRLTCKGVYLNGFSKPLPNDETTLLKAGQWYYYDVDYCMEYWLVGNINSMVYSTDGEKLMDAVTTDNVQRQMTLPKGRVYFKTTRSDATLRIEGLRDVQELGSFTAVALNVDGLPNSIAGITLNEDGPGSDGTKKISKYLASKNYDFIGCSEDFNYNGSLMESLGDYSCGTIRSTLSVGGIFGGFPFDTDGLNLIWKKSTTSATNETWTRWNDTESTDGNQYVKKGYRHYDMTIGGQTFDVYILHMDAGDTNATWSRESQWRQLTDAINGSNLNRPKLIIGDTNSRWTREDIKTNFMDRLNSSLTASDVWVEFYRNGVYPTTDMGDLTDQNDPTNYTNYEIVDKIIYINPTAKNTLQLVPQSFRIEQDYTYDTVEHNGNTNPLGDHKPVVVEFAYVISGDEKSFDLTLEDEADNAKAIADMTGAEVNVTLNGRTLYKDDSWNTLCLPFDLTVEGSVLDGATVMALDTEGTYEGNQTGFDTTSGTLYLYFDEVAQIEAGHPYIVKWSQAGPLVNPVFEGVTVSSAAASPVGFTKGSFVGTYSPVPLSENDKTVLFMGEENELYYPNTNMNVNACRAYFQLDEPFTAVRKFEMHFGGNTTGVEACQITSVEASFYSVDGKRLTGRPSQKGIYVKDGKKVVVM